MMKKKLIKNTADHFKKIFHAEPEFVVLSPGRINLIGEHVDYNDGFVLPAAINKYICFAVLQSGSDQCTIVAKDLNDAYKFSITDDVVAIEKMWANYILGVLVQLKERPVRGFNIVFSSTIPMGAGLSSSAALECGFAFALNTMFNLGLTKKEIALIGQTAEQTFAGVNCGIMDQFASVFGRRNHVIKLDCTTLDYQYHNADFKDYSLILFDSNVKHAHLTSGYNDRRSDVERGLSIVKARFPEVKSFRDCTQRHLIDAKSELGELIFRRCDYVVKEIKRVNYAVDSLETGDFATLGRLMYETHDGLSKDYEVSCPELDFLVAFAKAQDVAGARMMGGGFGGCSINLVKKGGEKRLVERMERAYRDAFGIEASVYKVKIADGTLLYEKN